MKSSFAILLSLVAFAAASPSPADLYNPNALFTEAIDYQGRVTVLQEDIVDTITSLRSQLSAILKRTSNATLSQVQDNIWDIFDLDAPVRALVFNTPTTDCILNLRVQLNMKTEFSGYDSSNCLTRYDRSVSGLINAAYGTLADYEKQIIIIQMLVVNSFIGRNVYLHPEEIIDSFRSQYDEHNAAWVVVKANIATFLASLEEDIGAQNTVLGTCFTNIQTDLIPQYNYITNATAVCTEFDSTIQYFLSV
jgi:hypothetical protein